MKLLLVLCVAIYFTGIHCDIAPKPDDTESIQKCVQDNHVTPQMIEEMKKQKSFTVNNNTKCLALCLIKGAGLVDAEGKVTDQFKNTEEVVACQKIITATEKCDLAAQFTNCLVKKEDFKNMIL